MSWEVEQSPDVVVVGGGIAGLAVAHGAARRGLRTLLLERGELAGQTTRVAAGMLAPVAEAAYGESALLELNLASGRAYAGWAAGLAEESGLDPGYRACGTLLVARDRDQAEALEREAAFRRSLGLALGRLRPSQARRLEPALAASLRLALDFPDDHAVDPRALAHALAAAASHAGARLRAGREVAQVDVEGDRVAGVRLADGTAVAAEHVVIAAGPWSGAVAGIPEHARVPVRPVKGQVLRLRDPAGPGLLRRVVRSEDAYLVPRGDGRYVLGATVEERGWDTGVTGGAVFELLRAAIELVPGVAELEVEELLAGLRPGTPDNAPALGPAELDGLHFATGHHRHGILLAPLTARIVVAGIAGDRPDDLAGPFSPGRFAGALA